MHERPVDVICQMDADLSHDPRHLPDLIAATARADVVIGSRYVPGGAIVNWPRRRRLLSRFANAYIRHGDAAQRARLHQRLSLLAARRARRAAARSLRIRRLLRSWSRCCSRRRRAGCRIAEVPITFVERRQGESKLSPAVLLESAVTPWRLAPSRRTAQPPVALSSFRAMV